MKPRDNAKAVDHRHLQIEEQEAWSSAGFGFEPLQKFHQFLSVAENDERIQDARLAQPVLK